MNTYRDEFLKMGAGILYTSVVQMVDKKRLKGKIWKEKEKETVVFMGEDVQYTQLRLYKMH